MGRFWSLRDPPAPHFVEQDFPFWSVVLPQSNTGEGGTRIVTEGLVAERPDGSNSPVQ